jgi:hypothetical protein
MWTAREGSARQAKWEELGEKVREVGIVFVCIHVSLVTTR